MSGPANAARRARLPAMLRARASLHPQAAAAGAALLCGAALPALRMAQMEAAPAQVALLRYAIACACLLVVLACAPRLRRARAGWLPAVLVDGGQFGVLVALLTLGLHFTSATRGGLIAACFPLVVLLFVVPLWKRPGAGVIAGAGLCALGLLLALGDGAYVRPARVAWLGEALVFVAVMLAAGCSLLCRPALARHATLPVMAGAMGAGALLMILLMGAGWSQMHFSPRAWLVLLYLGVSCAAAQALWIHALSQAPAWQVLPWLACAPLASSLLGAHGLRERQSFWLLAGLACVAAGLFLALRAAARALEAEEREELTTAAAPARPAPAR